MKVEIKAENDESFTLNPEPLAPEIKCLPFGDVFVACDGKLSAIGATEEAAINAVLEMQEHQKRIEESIKQEQVVVEIPQPPVNEPSRGARIENYTETNSFDYFSGTSWGGKKQG